MVADVIALHNDPQPGRPLLKAAMRDGMCTALPVPLARLREQTLAQLSEIPNPLHNLSKADLYPVEIADSLIHLASAVDVLTEAM